VKKSRYSEEQIVTILREGGKPNRTVVEVCRQCGISEHTYYRWRHRFGGMEVAEVHRLREMERENARLKRLVAERDLEIDAMRELLSKKP
jgi:putative transposase